MNNQELRLWQLRMYTKCCIENTLNNMIEERRRVFQNQPSTSCAHFEESAISMAIHSHGLKQNLQNHNYNGEDEDDEEDDNFVIFSFLSPINENMRSLAEENFEIDNINENIEEKQLNPNQNDGNVNDTSDDNEIGKESGIDEGEDDDGNDNDNDNDGNINKHLENTDDMSNLMEAAVAVAIHSHGLKQNLQNDLFETNR